MEFVLAFFEIGLPVANLAHPFMNGNALRVNCKPTFDEHESLGKMRTCLGRRTATNESAVGDFYKVPLSRITVHLGTGTHVCGNRVNWALASELCVSD